MPVLIDISRQLSKSTAHWPGDSPFDFGLPVRRESGNGINVGAFSASTHFGTHLDAPFHFTDSTETIDQLVLSPSVTPSLPGKYDSKISLNFVGRYGI
jgi:arylformamidase